MFALRPTFARWLLVGFTALTPVESRGAQDEIISSSQTTGEVGDACESIAQCRPGLTCLNQVCTYRLLEARCRTDRDCQSEELQCSFGRCRAEDRSIRRSFAYGRAVEASGWKSQGRTPEGRFKQRLFFGPLGGFNAGILLNDGVASGVVGGFFGYATGGFEVGVEASWLEIPELEVQVIDNVAFDQFFYLSPSTFLGLGTVGGRVSAGKSVYVPIRAKAGLGVTPGYDRQGTELLSFAAGLDIGLGFTVGPSFDIEVVPNFLVMLPEQRWELQTNFETITRSGPTLLGGLNVRLSFNAPVGSSRVPPPTSSETSSR